LKVTNVVMYASMKMFRFRKKNIPAVLCTAIRLV
jgi:hypothetical protein